MNVGHVPAAESITEARKVNVTLVGPVWVTSPTLFEPHGLREVGGVVSQKEIRVLLPKREQLGLRKQGPSVAFASPSECRLEPAREQTAAGGLKPWGPNCLCPPSLPPGPRGSACPCLCLS